MSQTIDISKDAEWWVGPEGEICIGFPHQANTHFMEMFDGVQSLPNAYPRFVWEKMGWKMLDKFLEDDK